MSRAFPETRVCSRATLFAVPSFSVLIETGECESSSFTAGTSALRAVGESFARPSSSSSRRKTTLASSRALSNRQAVPIGADHPEDRTAQFKFEGIGAVASRFSRNAEQRAAQCRIERRTEDLALRLQLPVWGFGEAVRVGTG